MNERLIIICSYEIIAYWTLLNTYCMFNGPLKYNRRMLEKLKKRLSFLSIYCTEQTMVDAKYCYVMGSPSC